MIDDETLYCQSEEDGEMIVRSTSPSPSRLYLLSRLLIFHAGMSIVPFTETVKIRSIVLRTSNGFQAPDKINIGCSFPFLLSPSSAETISLHRSLSLLLSPVRKLLPGLLRHLLRLASTPNPIFPYPSLFVDIYHHPSPSHLQVLLRHPSDVPLSHTRRSIRL
jgi:hypothetical protein